MGDILILLSCCVVSLGVSGRSRSVQTGVTLASLGNKSSNFQLRKRAISIKKAGNHPLNLSDGEGRRTKGTVLIVAARCTVCGEPVCLDRSTYQNNYECPLRVRPVGRGNRPLAVEGVWG